MKVRIVIVIFLNIFFIACSQNRGPGYKFDLFKATPNWELAKAIEEEDSLGIVNALKDKNVDINLQDKKRGRTLLLLAIGNEKIRSTRILLELGARMDICGNSGVYPINEAVHNVWFSKKSYTLTKLLLEHGADPNQKQIIIKGKDTNFTRPPMIFAAGNLNCAKLLLDYGANIYLNDSSFYYVWSYLFIPNFDYIYTLKYIIVDKKMPIPNPISFSIDKSKSFNIYNQLNRLDFSKDPERQKAKDDILEYLKKINFPNNQVYKDSSLKLED